MEKEIIKLKDSIEALNRTSKDMKVSFHYTDNDEEIDLHGCIITCSHFC